MKKILLLALAGLAFTSACKKDDDNTPATMQLSGTLSASNEKQATAVTSAATGTVTGTYTPSTKVLNYTITFSGLSGNPTGAHLHYGDAKHNGSVWLPFANLPAATSGTITGTTTLTTLTSASTPTVTSQPDSLTMGHVYANIHTAQYPNGEIRTTVVVK
ncbi:MAG: CHRD domain-containing protein [Janthinobacterium lividum]